MVKTRIIPCLDVKDGRVVKGINFLNLIDAGDPVEQAKHYSDDRESLIDLIRNTAKTTYHPCGTCAMGNSKKDHVVDENLLVHGCSNLRIADTSIMPTIVSGNLVASAYMIGEKAYEIMMGCKSL